MASGPFRWLLALAMPLMKKFGAEAGRSQAPPDRAALAAGPFGVVVAPLAGLRAGSVMKAALDGAFESGVLSRSAKALMFAVVARTLGCPHCEAAATQLLLDEGLRPAGDRKRHGDASLPPPAAARSRPAGLGARHGVLRDLRRSSRRRAPSAPNWAPTRCWRPSAWHRWRMRPSGWPCCWSDGTGLGPGRGRRPSFARAWPRSCCAAARQNDQLEKLLLAADEKLEQLQRQFERFVPADVVERLTARGDAFAPERRQVTMLFADLRGFTALCDRLDPAVTVNILNDYFRHMTAAIARHHGHVTEFVGDGLLALFGAHGAQPLAGARRRAGGAGHARGTGALQRRPCASKGLPELRFGIGIHGGEVVAGVIGTAGLSKFSVTGDPINVASRVEGLTSKYEVDLLITEDIRRAVGDEFRLRPMPPAHGQGQGGADPDLLRGSR